MIDVNKYIENVSEAEETFEERVNVAAGIIFKKSPQTGETVVLLIRRSPKDHWPLYWEFPRGKCDGGNDKNPETEHIKPCLMREVKEETGLDVIPMEYIDKFSYVADNGKRFTTQYNFSCIMKDENQPVVLSHEHHEYQWIRSVGEAELMCLPEMKKSISKIFNLDQQIVTYPDENDKIVEMVDTYLKQND